MASEFDLITSVINDPGVDEKFKTEERKRLAICTKCPTTGDKCWSCGCHEWWIAKGKSPAPFQR